MIVGVDTSPLYSGHKVRGVGFYTEKLLEELKKFRDIEILELKDRKEINRRDFDLLHIPYFNPFFFTLPFRKIKPTVVTIHDLIPLKYPQHYPPGIRGKLHWQIQKFCLNKQVCFGRNKVDAIITDSNASKENIVRLTGYPADRVHVIYLAAGKEFKKLKVKPCLPAGRSEKLKVISRKYRLPEKFVLFVGDVNWNKNIPGLVRACEKVGIPLVIVGKQAVSQDYDKNHIENRDLVWLQAKAKNSKFLNIYMSKSLILLGFIPTDDLVKIYNLATVYCQPSFDEGFGLPVLQAMSCGCPVVSSNRGSLPEVAGNAVMLVDPDKDELAKGIKKILEDVKLRNKLIDLGLKQVKKFSWKKTAEKTIEVYAGGLKKK